MQVGSETAPSRRDLLSLIGTVAGSAAMYQAMTSLGFAAESGLRGPIKLDGDVQGASVLVLGAGLAGMTAALELRNAGYKVQVLEFNAGRAAATGRCAAATPITELGGATQTCEFEPGLYLNPGPWRIPYHHRAMLDYCKRLNVALEPFVQLNHNALSPCDRTRSAASRSASATSRPIFSGQVAELLAKATQQGKLDEAVSTEDREILLAGAADPGARWTTTTPTRPA